MNFLAYIYLSGNSQSIMAGNFIAKIKTITDVSAYKKEIRDGIIVHQLINDFIKDHPSFLKSKSRLNPKYSKYANRIIEVFYDHFLAANWSEFSSTPLREFSRKSYRSLLNHHEILPYKAKVLLPYMIEGNWLLKYETLGGIHQIATEMSNKFINQTAIIMAFECLISNYSEFKQDFNEFFPQLVRYVRMINYQFDETFEAKSNQLAWAG